jgi:hypothetical protein
MKDLTSSPIDRQNILNNPLAIEKIQEYIGITGMQFEGEYRYTANLVASFFEVDIRTIRRYVDSHGAELGNNGYEVLKGQRLKRFKEAFAHILDHFEQEQLKDMDVTQFTEVPDFQIGKRVKSLAVFNFRAFLNIGMLLVESERARSLRGAILDIVIDTLNQKLGGSTKYVNQRDEEFFHAMLREPHYRKTFTNALHHYLDMGNYKYALYTDKIYKAIFQENAKEYKQILQIEDKENPRDTMYAEVLNLIASFENGLAYEMEQRAKESGRKLTPMEMDKLVATVTEHPAFKPLIENARVKMASRDYGFREILHENLKDYVKSIPPGEYQRFLGDKSKDLIERIEENIDVFKRLKDR